MLTLSIFAICLRVNPPELDRVSRHTAVFSIRKVVKTFTGYIYIHLQFAGGLRLAFCGRFASGMQAVCGRFACGLRRVSFAAGFVCRFVIGGLRLAVCVWRFAFGGLRLTVCAWRFALGGLRLAVCAWRFAFGGSRADCWRICGGFAGGLLTVLRAVYCWQFASGLRAASRRLSGDLRLAVCEISITPLQTRSNCASRNAGHLVCFKRRDIAYLLTD